LHCGKQSTMTTCSRIAVLDGSNDEVINNK
jgi:hypothetical protein